MSDTFTDVGWTGTPADVVGALAAHGYQVNADQTVTVIDPTKQGSVVAVTGYRLLDGVAYVLVRSTADVALPAGVSVVGPDHTSALSGVFMPDGTERPTTLTSAQFFDRFTLTEVAEVWAAAVANPAIGAGLVNGLATNSIAFGSPVLAQWMAGLVQAGILTQARHDVILTP